RIFRLNVGRVADRPLDLSLQMRWKAHRKGKSHRDDLAALQHLFVEDGACIRRAIPNVCVQCWESAMPQLDRLVAPATVGKRGGKRAWRRGGATPRRKLPG